MRAADGTVPPLGNRLAADSHRDVLADFACCGTAALAGDKIGYAGIAAAFGLAVQTMAYAVGHVCGGHFNPAVTIGLAFGRRFPWRDVAAYVVVPVVAASVASGLLADRSRSTRLHLGRRPRRQRVRR